MSSESGWFPGLAALAALITLAACDTPALTADAGDASAARDGGWPADSGAPSPCEGGCLVGGVCYPDGVSDPTNTCQVCDAATSTTAFSPRDGGACDDGSFCTIGDTCAAGVCSGAARSCDDGIACNGSESCDEDADACAAGTPSCASGEICDALGGACVEACAGCSIDGVCYGDGQVDPLDPCQVCDAGASRSAWSPNDGASCDDGDFCTVSDTCSGGSCGGGARECSDGVACNGVESCDEAADACVAGASTCGATELCDVATDTCTATCTGCVIAGVCFGDGQRNPDNGCEVCAPATSRSSWSPNDGARCDDGLFCTSGDVCAGTVCAGSATNFCDDGVACNGAEACDESTDRCQAGTTTCTGGTVCDGASDTCVLRCVGGSTLCGSTCVDTDTDPRHCGGCDTMCSAPAGATAVCIGGSCSAVCDEGFADCDGDPSTACTPVTDDERNCGACGNACAAGETCVAGVCELPPRFVFITSRVYSMLEWGSLAGADARCQELADAAGLPGTYKAWMSDAFASPSTRFTQFEVPYVRVDGVKVADGWADLTDGTLDARISVNEMGGGIPFASGDLACRVATATSPDGTLKQSNATCRNWTSTTEGAGTPLFAVAGDPTATSSVWSGNCWGFCGSEFAFYCFQQ